jgi:hypothetical protein
LRVDGYANDGKGVVAEISEIVEGTAGPVSVADSTTRVG